MVFVTSIDVMLAKGNRSYRQLPEVVLHRIVSGLEDKVRYPEWHD